MVKTILSVLLIYIAAVGGEVLANDSITVHVMIKGFKSEDGICRLLLYESESGFPDLPEDAALMLSENIRGKTAEFIFKVKRGKYAIAVLHDENLNKKMDKTWYGKPAEGFGTSNNPAVGFGPPGFEESAVNLNEHNHDLIITLNYL
jgi:uncharacterized protein (DUF2141 family)